MYGWTLTGIFRLCFYTEPFTSYIKEEFGCATVCTWGKAFQFQDFNSLWIKTPKDSLMGI